MKIALCHYVNGKSTKELAEWFAENGIKCDIFRLSDTSKRNFKEYDWVFAYGMGDVTYHKNRINSAEATYTCIDKRLTFQALNRANLPTVEFCSLQLNIPKKWEQIVCRKSASGRRADNMEIINRGDKIPFDCELFTEYFEHKYEYRVVVFKQKVVGHYFKKEEDGEWVFKLQPNRGFEAIDTACLTAAKALGIDYVGFDVVANTKNDFRILEANSGPILTDEAAKEICEFFLNL